MPAHLHKGSVFYKYLLSYLLILLIPVAMSVLVFGKARSVLAEEAMRANDLLLKQMQSHLDMVLSGVGRLRYVATNNDRLAGLMRTAPPVDGRQYYLAYQVAKDFNVYRISNEGAADFYVYLPGLDMIVSPNGYFTTRSYHGTQMSRLGITYDEWLGGLREAARTVYRPSRMETETNAVLDTVSIVSPLPAAQSTGVSLGWIVIHVDSRIFQDAFRNTAWNDQGLFLVFHRDQGIVAASRSDIPEGVAESCREAVLEGGREGTVRLDGRECVLLLRESSEAGLLYVSIVPVDLYAGRFTALTHYAIALFAACLVLGAVLIYLSAVSRYRPVGRILGILTPEAAGGASGADEFARIGAGLERTLEEGRRLRLEMSRSKPELAQRLFQQLLKGQAADDPAAAAELERLGVPLTAPRLALILAEVDDGDDGGPGVAQRVLQELWERELPEGTRFIRDLDGALGVLLAWGDAGPEGLRDLGMRLKAGAERRMRAQLALGMSDPHVREEGLRILYDEARTALEFRLVKGGSVPIAWRDVCSAGPSYDYPIEEETRLINSIRVGDRASASAILDGIWARNFGTRPLTLEMARCLMFDLISTMIKTADSLMSRDDDPAFWSRLRPFARLSACRSLERLRLEMDGILEAVCDHVTRSRTGHGEKLRGEILSFLHGNYRDRNLGPEAVAAHLGRNAAYLARFFRAEMSVGISGYIKRYRVSRARELLAEGGHSVSEIADLTGFAGSNALIRAFKEVEGVTPGQFKESLPG